MTGAKEQLIQNFGNSVIMFEYNLKMLRHELLAVSDRIKDLNTKIDDLERQAEIFKGWGKCP